MLKKVGIIMATAAAGLLAVSPLAFAGDDHGKTEIEDVDGSKTGIINGAGNDVDACDDQVPIDDARVLLDLPGAQGPGAAGPAGTDAETDGDSTIDDSCTAEARTGDSAGTDD